VVIVPSADSSIMTSRELPRMGLLTCSAWKADDPGTFTAVCVKMAPGMMDCAGWMTSLVRRDHALAGMALAAGDGKKSGHGPRR